MTASTILSFAALVSLPDLLHPTPPEAVTDGPPMPPEQPCFGTVCALAPATRTVHALDYPRLGFDAASLQYAQRQLVDACEARGGRIALLDLPPGLRAGDIVQWRHALASSRAALYTPWLRVDADGSARTVPPAAAACGITAQLAGIVAKVCFHEGRRKPVVPRRHRGVGGKHTPCHGNAPRLIKRKAMLLHEQANAL